MQSLLGNLNCIDIASGFLMASIVLTKWNESRLKTYRQNTSSLVKKNAKTKPRKVCLFFYYSYNSGDKPQLHHISHSLLWAVSNFCTQLRSCWEHN